MSRTPFIAVVFVLSLQFQSIAIAADPTINRTLTGHTAPVRAVAYSPNGEFLASCSDDLTVKLWDPTTGKELRTIVVLKQPAPKKMIPKGAPPKVAGIEVNSLFDAVVSLDISPDGTQLAVTADKEVKLFNTKTGGLDGTLQGHQDKITAVRYASTGNVLASTAGRELILWDIKRRSPIKRIMHVTPPLFTFTPDGTKLLSADNADTFDTMRFNEIKTGKELGLTLDGQRAFVKMKVTSDPLTFSPNGKILLVNGSLYEWVSAKKLCATENGSPSRFNSTGTLLAGCTSGAGKHGAALWDTATGKQVAFIDTHFHTLEQGTVSWSPDGKFVAVLGISPDSVKKAASKPDGIMLWELPKNLK